jgi:hypothetical protein
MGSVSVLEQVHSIHAGVQVRAAFANLKPELCAEAAARLKAGLEELVAGGMPAVRSFLDSWG